MADASSSSDTSTFSILRKLSKVMFMQKLNPLWAYIPGVLSLRDGMKNLLRERKGLNVFKEREEERHARLQEKFLLAQQQHKQHQMQMLTMMQQQNRAIIELMEKFTSPK